MRDLLHVSRWYGLLVVLVGVVAGCGLFGNDGASGGQTTDRVEVPPGLDVTLDAPAQVAPGDSFEVRVSVENTTDDPVVVRTSYSCLVRPSVYADGDRVSMKGANLACAAVITDHTFDPRQRATHTFDVQAVQAGSDGEEPVASGTYEVRVPLDWRIDGQRHEETLIGVFEVD